MADEIVSRVEAAGGHLNREALGGAIDAHHLQDGAISTRDWRLLVALKEKLFFSTGPHT